MKEYHQVRSLTNSNFNSFQFEISTSVVPIPIPGHLREVDIRSCDRNALNTFFLKQKKQTNVSYFLFRKLMNEFMNDHRTKTIQVIKFSHILLFFICKITKKLEQPLKGKFKVQNLNNIFLFGFDTIH
jgi:hypothetical protein